MLLSALTLSDQFTSLLQYFKYQFMQEVDKIPESREIRNIYNLMIKVVFKPWINLI